MSLKPILNLSFGRGVGCGMFAMLAANGLYWFQTPISGAASDLRVAGVIGQIVVCALGAVWLYARERRSTHAAPQTPAEAR